MKQQNKKAHNDIRWYMQLHFVVAVGAFFAATFGFSLVMMLSQLPENTNFSGSFYYLVSSLLLPIVCGVASYLLAPRPTDKLERIFWVVLLTSIALLIFGFAQQMSLIVPLTRNYFVLGDNWIINEAIRMAVCFIPVTVYFVYIHWLRKKITR